MLRKALKYDLQASFRPFVILTLSLLGISIICGISIRDLMINGVSSIYSVLSVIGFTFSVFGVCAYVIGITLIVLYRFYLNFFTDEGYLTFTLPVKRSTLFNSKILTSLIYTALSTAAIAIFFIIVLLIAPTPDGNGTLLVYFFKNVAPVISNMLGFSDGWTIACLILLVLLIGVSQLFNSLLLHACITLGCIIAKKHKILATIGVYYGVYMVTGILSYVFSFIMSIAAIATLNAGIDATGESFITFLLLLAAIAFVTLFNVAVYNFTLTRIKSNLNLA